MGTLQTLDVRIIEPQFKHLVIFKNFNDLKKNNSFIIINDHDPKALYYKMSSLYPGIFSWEYLKSGPVEWIIKISKTNEKEKTIGQLAAEDYKKATIFKNLGINYCCEGKKTLKEVAKKKGIDIKMIEDQFLTFPDNKSKEIENFQNWNIESLINYIVDSHHSYIKKTIPEITQIFCKILNEYSSNNPKLDNIFKIYLSMSNDLTNHMTDEESVLFPYINSLKNSTQFTIPKQSVLHGAINIMEFEHISLISYFEEIRELSRQYEVPTEACSGLKILYSSLNEMEEDLKELLHLENNILFPKAMTLEQQIINTF